MKLTSMVCLSVLFCSNLALAMTQVDAPNTGDSAAPVSQSGKVDVIHAGASKLVINGVTYAYNPLTTLVTVKGKRATVSDVRSGDIVQFQASSQGANKPALLTTINVQR